MVGHHVVDAGGVNAGELDFVDVALCAGDGDAKEGLPLGQVAAERAFHHAIGVPVAVGSLRNGHGGKVHDTAVLHLADAERGAAHAGRYGGLELILA